MRSRPMRRDTRVLCDATLASYATRHSRLMRRDARVLCDATLASYATRHSRPMRRDTRVLCDATLASLSSFHITASQMPNIKQSELSYIFALNPFNG